MPDHSTAFEGGLSSSESLKDFTHRPVLLIPANDLNLLTSLDLHIESKVLQDIQQYVFVKHPVDHHLLSLFIR